METIKHLESLAEYMERRAALHLRNGNVERWEVADKAARMHRRNIELHKDRACYGS